MNIPMTLSKKIKLILFVSFIIILPIILFGCKALIEKPVKTNVFDFSAYSAMLVDNTSEVLLSNEKITFNQSDATQVEDYMFVRNILLQFEEQQYQYEINSISSSKEQAILNNNFKPISEMTDSLALDTIQIELSAYKEDTLQKTYTLFILGPTNNSDDSIATQTSDTTSHFAFIANDKNMLRLSEGDYSQLINSGLLLPRIDTSRIPQTILSDNPIQLEGLLTAHWNQHVIDNRYIQSELNNGSLNTLQTYAFDEPTQLTLDWDIIRPSECQISFIPQTDTYTSDEDQEITLTTDANSFIPTPLILKVTDQAPVMFELPELEGKYLVEITSTWLPSDNSDFGTTTEYVLIKIDYPENITLQNTTIEPGDLIVIEGKYLDDLNNYSIETNLTSKQLSFTPYEQNDYLFIPLMSKYTPGNYYVNVKNLISQEYISKFSVTITEKEFQIQELSTSTATASLQNDANNKQLEEAFARARANPIQEKLWTGPFLQPVGGRISTEYGTIRYTNGAETGSRHSGIDFANPTGTVVKATQSGYVVLAEFLNITGNTLIIDHGLGFYSQYYHLDSIDVKLGDFVTVGTEVATIGTTGFSTGPHLHFTIYYGGIYLNPWKFFENAPF